MRLLSASFPGFCFRAAALLAATFGGLTLTAQAAPKSTHGGHGAPWFEGTVEAAYAKAKAEKKPILLYWGAVWCPPCNELKNEVFAKPRFAELMAPMLAVYLDGDSFDAQSWAEKLKVSGYPTVLVLDSSGKEVWRLSTTTTIGEFETALTSALAAGRNINEVMDRALAEKASDDDWRMLAYYSWGDVDELKLKGQGLLQARRELALKAPAKLKTERALLAAAFLEACGNAAQDAKTKAEVAPYVKDAEPMLALIFADDSTIKASRSTLLYMAAEIIGWGFPDHNASRDKATSQWLAAAEVIRNDSSFSIDTRTWTWNPALTLFRLDHPDGPVPPELAQSITKAVATADQEAKTPYERHAAISGAADLLRQIGDYPGARQLLDKELAVTDTPWYYQSVYASVERTAGDKQAALAWSAKARQSVKGRASRLQWIVEDLAMTAKLGTPATETPRLEGLVKEYYDMALSLPDGFKGRNSLRAKKVADNLKPWLERGTIKKLVSTYAGRCHKDAKAHGNCHEHFASLLPGV